MMKFEDALGTQHCIRNTAFNGHLRSTQRRMPMKADLQVPMNMHSSREGLHV